MSNHPTREWAYRQGLLPTGNCAQGDECDGINCRKVWFNNDFLRAMSIEAMAGISPTLVEATNSRYPGWLMRAHNDKVYLSHESNTVDRKRVWVLTNEHNLERDQTLGVWPD